MADKRIFFGSLEHSVDVEKLQAKDLAIRQAVEANANSREPEVLPFSEKTIEAQQKYKESLIEMEARRRARVINIPTDDKVVQMKLRELGEPIIYFGEGPPERRERLRNVMARLGIEDATPTMVMLGPKETQRNLEQSETFYTEGTPELKNARVWISKYSLAKARDRVQSAKRQRIEEEQQVFNIQNGISDSNHMEIEKSNHAPKNYEEIFDRFSNSAAQVADERPLSYITFNSDGQEVLTSGWSGICKVWNINDCSQKHEMIGHKDRALCAIYHPQASTQSEESVSIGSCGADGAVMLWNRKSRDPVRVLKSHTNRINRIGFHPSGRFLGSASTDMTWKLWDVEAGREIMEQEGHSRGVYAIAFQGDGSLVSTGGYDEIGRVWDLRSGRSIWVLRGHSKTIYGLQWAPNGYHMLSSSEDNTIKIWDMRKRRNLYTIYAHESLISQCTYSRNGEVIISCSFDMSIRLWDGREFTPIKNIKGTEAKIMCCDISPDFKKIVTASYDRSFRIYEKEI